VSHFQCTISMNKNIFILSISVLSILNCSNDDDTHETEIKKYPESIILIKDGESNTTKISYNDKMQIIGYSEPYSNITFTYQNNSVAEVRENNNSVPYTLQYTNGLLSGLTHYSKPYPVIFNSPQMSYSIEDLLSFGLDGKTFLMSITVLRMKISRITTVNRGAVQPYR